MRKFFVVAALIVSSQLSAQQDSSILDEVVITATKYPEKQSNTGKVVTVVNRQQIERSLGKDLSQLLNEQTGLTIGGAYSNPGKDKSLFLRGATSNYTLILLDGIPLNDPSGVGGTFDIRLIPLEQIERIEILKGSQSTLYGANAMAGVVNIISHRATSPETTGSGALSYGSFNSFKGNAAFSKKGRRADYSLNYEYFNTDGITEAKDTTDRAGFDRDGFNRHSFSGNLGFNLGSSIRLAPYFRYSAYKGRYDLDAFTDGPNKYDASLLNTGLIGTLAYQGGKLTLNYAYDDTKRSYDGYPFAGKFHHAEAYVNQTLHHAWQLLAGLSYQLYHLPQPDTTNTLFSPYASLVWKPGGLSVELGGRFNHHNRYGDNMTYSLNPSYLLHDRLKLFASLSTGFRAPSISELYGPYGANPDLKPEKSRNIEGGIQVFGGDRKWSGLVTYFNREVKDVIISVFPRGHINRDLQQDHGIETELAFQPGRWNIKAAYTYVNGKVTQKLPAKDTSFYNLIRRPKHTINLFAAYQLTKNLLVSSSLQSFSKRTDLYYNPVTFGVEPRDLDAYILWNAYAEYRLPAEGLTFFVDVKNITNDRDHYEVYGYNVQGTSINGGIRFKL